MDHYLIFKIAPVAKGRPRFSRSGHAFTPAKTRQFEKEIGTLAKTHWGTKKLLNQNLEAIVTFQCMKPKSTKLRYPSSDLDNYLKAIFDSLNEIVYIDDRQIVKVTASKIWGDEDCIKLVLTEI